MKSPDAHFSNMIIKEALSPVIRRYAAWLRSEVPCNFRTMAFAFFCGSILSFPIGLTLARTARPFDPPEWTGPIYGISFLGSLLLLPFWSYFALRSSRHRSGGWACA